MFFLSVKIRASHVDQGGGTGNTDSSDSPKQLKTWPNTRTMTSDTGHHQGAKVTNGPRKKRHRASSATTPSAAGRIQNAASRRTSPRALESPWAEHVEPSVQVGQSEKSSQAEYQERGSRMRNRKPKAPWCSGEDLP